MTHASSARSPRTGPFIDRLFGWLAKGAAVLTLLLLLAILASLLVGAWPAIAKFGLGFLTRSVWDPVQEDFGGLVMIYGTLATSLIALLIAVPVSFGIALFLTELSPAWLKRPLGTAIELLAAVPSIVYGILGLGFIARAMGFGQTVLAAALTLTLLVLPIMIIAAREAIRAVPSSIRHASLALGATQWQTIRHQVLPAAVPGIATGSILALSRAIGEAAPIIMLGGLTFITFNPDGPLSAFTVLPIQIFNWISRPQEEFRVLAAAAIVVLLVILLCMNATAILLRNKYGRRW